MDYFQAVKAFVSLADTGSFVRTAALLGIPRNNVTKLIQGLEAHLQVQLLHRTTRQVSLSPDGAAYYERIVPVLAQWQQAEAGLGQMQDALVGRLRVGMSAVVAALVAIPALPAFQARYPELQLELAIGERAGNLVRERMDCVVQAGLIADPSLITRQLGELPLVLCAAPAYLARHGTPAHPAALEQQHTLVRYFFPGSERRAPIELSHGGTHIAIGGRHLLALDDHHAYLAAGLAGLGIVHLPRCLAQAHLDSGALVPLLTQWSSPPLPVTIAYLPNGLLEARIRVFVDWISECLALPATAAVATSFTVRPE